MAIPPLCRGTAGITTSTASRIDFPTGNVIIERMGKSDGYLEDLRQIMRDLAVSTQETQKSLQELAEAQQRTEKAQQRTEEAQQRTEEAQQRTEKGFEEMWTAVKETQKTVEKQAEALKEAGDNFNSKWGKFMEKLVEGNLIELLQEAGIDVQRLEERRKIKDKNKRVLAEYDLIVINGSEVVVVEVKTTLTKEKVGEFLEKLKKFKDICRYHREKKVYGAVAYLDQRGKAREEAIQRGLFVIEAPGENVEMATLVNPKEFVPKEF